MKQQPYGDMTVREQAALWLTELEDATPAVEARFAEWLKQSQRHVEEFLFLSTMWEEFDGVDPERRIDLDALVAAAKASGPHKVVPLRSVTLGLHPVRMLSWRLAAAVAVLGLGLAAGWVWLAPLLLGADVYSTSVGEQRTIKLADGSVIHLNTHTRVAVDYSSQARDMKLIEGEALFAVQRDQARPFRVRSDDIVVLALGTQFNVYRNKDGATVSVLEGVVQVSGRADLALGSPASASPPGVAETGAPHAPTRVAAGEQVEATARGGIVKQAVPDLDKAMAWRARRLVFRSTSLEDVAAEFNRYNELKIRVEGAAVRDKRLIGTFNADDPQALVQFLSSEQGLAAERDGSALVIRPR